MKMFLEGHIVRSEDRPVDGVGMTAWMHRSADGNTDEQAHGDQS